MNASAGEAATSEEAAASGEAGEAGEAGEITEYITLMANPRGGRRGDTLEQQLIPFKPQIGITYTLWRRRWLNELRDFFSTPDHIGWLPILTGILSNIKLLDTTAGRSIIPVFTPVEWHHASRLSRPLLPLTPLNDCILFTNLYWHRETPLLPSIPPPTTVPTLQTLTAWKLPTDAIKRARDMDIKALPGAKPRSQSKGGRRRTRKRKKRKKRRRRKTRRKRRRRKTRRKRKNIYNL